MRSLILAITIAVTTSAAAFAADPQPVAQPATDDSNKMICRHMVNNGVLLRTVRCRTAREWDALLRQQQREVLEQQIRGLAMNNNH
jgi:hypothetical protein